MNSHKMNKLTFLFLGSIIAGCTSTPNTNYKALIPTSSAETFLALESTVKTMYPFDKDGFTVTGYVKSLSNNTCKLDFVEQRQKKSGIAMHYSAHKVVDVSLMNPHGFTNSNDPKNPLIKNLLWSCMGNIECVTVDETLETAAKKGTDHNIKPALSLILPNDTVRTLISNKLSLLAEQCKADALVTN